MEILDNTLLPGGVNPSQLETWKRQHGKVHQLTLKNRPELAAYFRNPKLTEIKASTAMAKRDEIDALFTLYNNCKLYVSAEIEADDMLKLSIASQLGILIKLEEVEVKNV